jgi:transposase-like protein
MTLKQTCPHCGEKTLARRIRGFYVGSETKVYLWECRSCMIAWSNHTKGENLS